MADYQRMYPQIMLVEGSGQFFFDMLRYDNCRPWREEDSHALTRSGARRIYLMRYALDPNRPPTVGRWESRGWRVVGIDRFSNASVFQMRMEADKAPPVAV